ncbi:MAG: hypothetical protein R3C03_02160 [Pirellulaceae bacterium]
MFARSVASQDEPMLESHQVLWLEDKTDSGNKIETYATHLHSLRSRGDRVSLFAEVFWGDLSRVRRGIIGALIGLLEILFGIRYISYVAAYQKGFGARLLRRLGLICTNILHGPVLAITFFLAILTLALAGTELMWPESYKGILWTRILMCGVCSVAFLISNVGERFAENSGIKRFWFWVNVTTAFVSGLMLVKTLYIDTHYPEMAFTDSVRPGLIWYCRVLVMMLALFWITQMFFVVALGICWGIAIVAPTSNRTALHVAFLLPALSVGFWGLLLPMLWLVAANSLKKFVALDQFQVLFEEAVPLLGIQVLMAGVVLLGSGIVLVLYFRWRQRYLKDQNRDPGEPPRLIVHQGLQFATAISTLIGVSLVAVFGTMQLAGSSYEDIWGGQQLADANKYSAILLAPLGVLAIMLFPHLRPALDIVLDVMNHFFFRATRIDDAINDDEFDIMETTLESGSLYFSRRDAIHLRIKKTLAYFRDHLETRPRLTIISHSQGTMIAIEVLNDPELAWLNASFSEVRLVTMGSPFAHLYQHYFSHLYPALTDPFWEHLHGRLTRWCNIFRRDDFVGTRINFDGTAEAEMGRYTNHPVGLRGHMHYWNDREVLAILEQQLQQTASQPRMVRRAA